MRTYKIFDHGTGIELDEVEAYSENEAVDKYRERAADREVWYVDPEDPREDPRARRVRNISGVWYVTATQSEGRDFERAVREGWDV